MRLSFFGATGTVTGSRYLLEHGGRRVLIDCGLFQGLKQLRLRNREPLPVPPSTIDTVVLTHAHLDHSGYIPRLVRQGFRGKVLCTPATHELCGLLLPDSGRLLEEEAEHANRHGYTRHEPALPLYTEEDATAALERFRLRDFDEAFEVMPGVRARLRRAGHLLGAASVHVEWGGGCALFSGDLGREDDLLMRPPAAPDAAHTVVIESTYGDRSHGNADPLTVIAEVIGRTAARGGLILVPSFAVGRAQTLLYALHLLKQQRRIPDLPVYVNSPMATNATQVYQRHVGGHRLTRDECRDVCSGAHFVNSEAESRRLNALRMPAIIISASGMATGGRVLHHLTAYAPHARNTILFAGYQAAGTRGASMVGGAPTVKMHGEHVPVRAEVVQVDALSAHADREGLLGWIGRLPSAPRRVFVTHGEPVPADRLRQAIQERYGWACSVPEHRDSVDL